jgi:hypothetical protein
VFGVVYGGQYPVTIGTSYPVLIFAFPAAIGALIGYESRSTALIGNNLSVRLSALITVACSLACSGLFIAQTAGRLRYPTGHFLFGIGDNLWQIAVLTGLFNSLLISYLWLVRIVTFYRLANRAGSQTSAEPSEFFARNGNGALT